MLKTASVTPKSTGTTARRRRATQVSTARAGPDAGYLRSITSLRTGYALKLYLVPCTLARNAHTDEVVHEGHGERLVERELLDGEIDGAALGGVGLAPALLQQLVELGVLHARPVEVAAHQRRVKERVQAVGVDGAQEHHGAVRRAAVVVLVPGRPRLRLDLHVDADLAERGLDERGRRVGAAPVLDGVEHDLEPLPPLGADAVRARHPPRLLEQRLGAGRIVRIGLAQRGSSSMAAVSGRRP